MTTLNATRLDGSSTTVSSEAVEKLSAALYGAVHTQPEGTGMTLPGACGTA